MKRVLIGALVISVSSFTFASETGPGCGLGSQVFKGKKGVFSHVLAATTNGTSGNQTFGMTSGTLGCDANQTIQVASLYMDSNVDKVAAEMSIGKGESLNALAELLGVDAKHKAHFNQLLKENFNQVFASEETTSNEAINNIVALMEKDSILNVYIS
ncbi:DUF3015 domain-containing protein [Pleionea sediminis]|uniref:DUF3015 domain-containing protein n=1 Tax=Pleionea sediminis TaxID=2569479 RepID=UPI001185FABC|nr:DUF3015 domain-containing protein [Pleionea sediminis]